MQAESSPPTRQPLFNAPLIVVVMAVMLIALHAGYAFAPYDEQVRMLFEFALVPSRFHAEAGSDIAYPSFLHAGLTLFSTSLLHAGWGHVLMNAAMLLAFGTPVARALADGGVTGAGKWMIVFLGSVAAGSIVFLALNGPETVEAVGASGGTSGLIAAAFLLDPTGRVISPLSRQFLSATLVFIILNVVLVFAGPVLLGMGIAWEAHAGGYVAGAGLILLLGRRWIPSSGPEDSGNPGPG
jgi:membrane associated rhomboid family serine protease